METIENESIHENFMIDSGSKELDTTTEQGSGERTDGYETTATKVALNVNHDNHTPFLTDAPPDFYDSGMDMSNTGSLDEENKRLLQSQHLEMSDTNLTTATGDNSNNEAYRSTIRKSASYSSFSSSSTISTNYGGDDGSIYDHVGALLNRDLHLNKSYEEDDDDRSNNDDNGSQSTRGTMGEMDHVHALLLRGSSTMQRPPLVTEDSGLTNQITVVDEFEQMALQPPAYNSDKPDATTATTGDSDSTDNDSDSDNSDSDDSDASELSRSDFNLQKTPFDLIQQKEEDMLSLHQLSMDGGNELFIGDSTTASPKLKARSGSIYDSSLKDSDVPPPLLPHDDGASSSSEEASSSSTIHKSAALSGQSEATFSHSSSSDNDDEFKEEPTQDLDQSSTNQTDLDSVTKRDLDDAVLVHLIIHNNGVQPSDNDDCSPTSTNDDDDNDEQNSNAQLSEKEEAAPKFNKFQFDDSSEDDGDCETWEDEPIEKQENHIIDDENNDITSIKSTTLSSKSNDEEVALLFADYQQNHIIDDDNNDNTSIKSTTLSSKSNDEEITLLSADYQQKDNESRNENNKNTDDMDDIEKGDIRIEDKPEMDKEEETNIKASIDYDSSIFDDEIGINVYDKSTSETEADDSTNKEKPTTTNKKSNKMKLIGGIICFLLVITGIVVGVILATQPSEEAEITEPETPDDTNPITVPISILQGTENVTHFAKIISSSNDGTRVAIVGYDAGTTNEFIQIYDLMESSLDNNIALEVTGSIVISNSSTTTTTSNSNVQVLSSVLSDDGQYLVIATIDYVQVYTKPSNDNDIAWIPYGQEIPISPSTIDPNTGIPISITNNGTIFAMSIPNYRVDIYYYNEEEWLLRGTSIDKPLENSDSFGNSISLSSSTGNRIVIGADGSNNVFIYEYHDDLEEYIDIFNGVPISTDEEGSDSSSLFGYSVSMNENGNRVAIGAPNYNGYTNALLSSGRCNIYDIIRIQDNETNNGTTASNANYTWSPIGEKIYGQVENENFGAIVSLTSNGDKIAISSPGENLVRVYELQVFNDDKHWEQIGSNFKDDDGDDESYSDSISLSSDGTTLYVGAPGSDTSATNLYGTTFVYNTVSQESDESEQKRS